MSLAKKCDRCGKLYEIYSRLSSSEFNGVITSIIHETGDYSPCRRYDLCRECRDKLKNFLDNEEDK